MSKKIKACAGAALAILTSVGAQANSYTIVDLGPKTFATGIDSKGEISGGLQFNLDRRRPQERARVYSGGRWWQEPSHHENAEAVAVSKGRVVGTIADLPVVWVHHGEPVTVEVPGTNPYGVPTGMDSSGNVSGYFLAGGHGQHCFLWSFSTGLSEDLGTLGDGGRCQTAGMDDRGRIYGFSTFEPGGRWHAFVWHQGHVRRLPPLVPDEGSSMAVAGNDSRDVVGWTHFENDLGELYQHAALWRDGAVIDVAPKVDTWTSVANAINDAGTIVGQVLEYGDDGDERHAYRFSPEGAVSLRTEVADPGDWLLFSATGVSPAGVIVGWGARSDGKTHGFMLVPR